MSLFGDPSKDAILLNQLQSIVEQLSKISEQLESMNKILAQWHKIYLESNNSKVNEN